MSRIRNFIKVEIDRRDIRKIENKLEEAEQAINDGLNKGILEWLQVVARRQIDTKPWQDQTGRLRASHDIEQVEDGWWKLEANPEKYQGAEQGNYAPILELGLNPRTSKDWSWFYKVVDQLEPEVNAFIADAIENELKK